MDCNKCLLCRCGKFEVHGMSCIIEQKHIGEVEICPLDRLAAYVDAEEQGLLVRLPCKVGDTVWVIITSYVCGELGDLPETRHYIEKRLFKLSILENFGKTVFLTREEAEAALAKED